MVCSILNEEDELQYQQYVENHPDASFEYSLDWRKIIQNNFGFIPSHVIYKDSEGKIKGILPLFKAHSIFGTRLVAVPYAIYAGILADTEEAQTNIINFVKEMTLKSRLKFIEIREKDSGPIYPEFQKVSRVFNFSLQLSPDIDEVWKKLPKGSVRWGIKKAQNSGLTFTAGNSKSDLNHFYRLFLQTRKYRGVPSYPLSYFKDIANSFGKNVKIYTAFLGEKPLASIFLIYHKQEMRYAFAGTIHKQEYLKMQPYHLIFWEAIKDASSQGYNVFNLGGAAAATNEGGLYGFKKKWADEIISISSFYYLCQDGKLPQTETALLRCAAKAWSFLPLSLIRLLSPKVIKQFV